MLKLFSIFFSVFVQASPLPPGRNPKTLLTDHFEIVYYAEQQDLAYHYARELERAHLFLSGVFVSQPQEKIVVVINDSTDAANGFATRIPYPYTMLFPVLPDLNDSLSEIDQWTLELTTHELAHVLSFEPAGGVMGPLRSVFGTVIAPNLLLPLWWKEGLSVWSETAVGKAGRLRSIYQEATLRAWWGHKNFLDFTVAQANETLPEWPWGSRPYLFGSLTMSYLISQQGEKVMTALTERHGRTLPYLYQGLTREIMGKTYSELYVESQLSWEKKAGAQLQELSKIPLETGTRIETGDLNVRSPTISFDGKKLAWVASDEKPKTRIRVAHLSETGQISEPVTVVEDNALREVRFFPKSDRILFHALKSKSSVELYSDLFVYDFSSQKTTRLTKALRGREAQVSPDEKSVVFVGLEGGRTHLRLLDLDQPKNMSTLLSSDFDQRIASPQFLDSRTLLYSLAKSGRETLYLYDLDRKTSKPLPQQGERMRRPLVVGGKVYFLSDENRVFNLYSWRDLKTFQKESLTHVPTTLLDFGIHPNQSQFFASLITESGPRLFYFTVTKDSKNQRTLPVPTALLEEKNLSTLPPAPKLESVATQEAPRSYKLWPHYWIPFIAGSTSENGALISVSTSGQDPTLQHSYSAQLTYDTGVEEVSYLVAYENRTREWPWRLQSGRLARAFVSDPEELYYNQVHGVALAPDFSQISDSWGFQASYLYSKYEDDLVTYERSGPEMRFSFSDATQTLWMISPEEGSAFSLAWGHFLKSSELPDYNQLRISAEAYWNRWLPPRHALAIQLNGLLTDERIPSILGDASTVYGSDLTSDFLMRGFLEGQFTGRNLINANLEYRWPLNSFTKGYDLLPLYVRRIHGAIALDALVLDGLAYQKPNSRDIVVDRGTVFSSAGAEIRVDTTVGYILPIQFVFGVHKALQEDYLKDTNVLFQIKADYGF